MPVDDLRLWVREVHGRCEAAWERARVLRVPKLPSQDAPVLPLSAALSSEDARLLQWSTAACAAGIAIGIRLGRVRPFWRRIVSVHQIDAIGPISPVLRGRVVTVADGDTLRLLHVPTFLHSTRLRNGDKVSTNTLQVRLCTIDAPETGKFGKLGQPFGEEAKRFLERLVLGRMVSVRVLAKDQYGRAVGSVVRGWWPLRAHVDQEMLRAGLAEVYRGSGAVYGPLGKAHYVSLEAAAQQAGRGLWAQGAKVESAAAFKARSK